MMQAFLQGQARELLDFLTGQEYLASARRVRLPEGWRTGAVEFHYRCVPAAWETLVLDLVAAAWECV
jgi:hypothetical protein